MGMRIVKPEKGRMVMITLTITVFFFFLLLKVQYGLYTYEVIIVKPGSNLLPQSNIHHSTPQDRPSFKDLDDFANWVLLPTELWLQQLEFCYHRAWIVVVYSISLSYVYQCYSLLVDVTGHSLQIVNRFKLA